MNNIEKVGLGTMIVASSYGPFGTIDAGIPAMVVFIIGWLLFFFGNIFEDIKHE